MPLIETTGSGSAKALGLNSASGPVNYIEDVFSTYLYTGNSAARTITNGIDLSGKGGLVWIKNRSSAFMHVLYDTSRGALNYLTTTSTAAQSSYANSLTAFNSNGFNVGTVGEVNGNGWDYVPWTFRKQAKFFDIVTYTGNGANRTIAHNLGSVPGCIIVKRTDTTGAWQVYHRSLANTQYLVLDTFAGTATGTTRWNSTTPTSTVFSVGTDTTVNANGGTYVAYLFAHDAGGFGLTGADNVISCGSFTTDSLANATVNLGYEPQWVMIKDLAGNQYFAIYDNMRGLTSAVSGSRQLFAGTSSAEGNNPVLAINSTGFSINQYANTSYVYIAIRRGPMKTPTSGTSVYENVAYTGNNTAQTQIGSSVLMDMTMISSRTGTSQSWSTYAHYVYDRLRGDDVSLSTAFTGTEVTGWSTYFDSDVNVGWDTGSTTSQGYLNGNSQTYVSRIFKRAPGFMDVVCYTGTGTATTFSHNLGVVPELMIVKSRSNAVNWAVYHSALGATKYLQLNTDIAATTSSLWWNNTAPTSSVFTVGNGSNTGGGGYTYAAYLFASCPGVSKVGSYSGTGATQTISCGFATRFVMIKRTDSTGDWWVWDTARGMVAGTDPRLGLNLTTAETNANWVYTDASGFQIVTTDASVNASGGSYIYLAIA